MTICRNSDMMKSETSDETGVSFCLLRIKGGICLYKIAVIDDNRAIATMIETTIPWKKLNCVVVGVEYGGLRGKMLIEQQRPDIVIADIHMPGMDGLEMIQFIRAANIRTKVIFISAYDDFSYAQRAIALHASEYLLKPFENEKLIDCVKRVIEELAPMHPSELEPDARAFRPIDVILQYIKEHPTHSGLQEVAERFGYSASYLGTMVKKETGINYMEWVIRTRLELSKKLLRDPTYRIEEVASLVGYKNYLSFYHFFVKHAGVSPRDYRNGGAEK